MRVLIKGVAAVAPAATPIPDLLHQWEDDFVLVWGLNDQRNQTWWQDHNEWPSNHQLEWFQLHGLGHMVEAHGQDYLVWLSGLDCPLYMFRGQIARWPVYVNQELKIDIPLPEHATPYPVEPAIQLAGRKYITNTFSYQVALAILIGATHIHITGLTLGEDTKQLWDSRRDAADYLEDCSEYFPGNLTSARKATVIKDLRGEGAGEESWIIPNLEFWLGIARGRGIEVTVTGGHLFYDKWNGLYGLEAGGEY